MKSLSSSRREVLVDCFHVHACHIGYLLPDSAVIQHAPAAFYKFFKAAQGCIVLILEVSDYLFSCALTFISNSISDTIIFISRMDVRTTVGFIGRDNL